MRRIVVGHSGGVTSAWCLGWALRTFPREEVIALWHDTKKEDADTLRFLREISAKLGIEITERSDGRSVEEVEDDEGALANNRMAFCSRILKAIPKQKYFEELLAQGITEIVNVLGFSGMEWERIQRHTMLAERGGYAVRFPVKEEGKSKQECADWCLSLGVKIPSMYAWSEHANCVGCRRAGKAYWLKLSDARPDVFEIEAAREKEWGHTFLNGTTLHELKRVGLKRAVKQRESIEIGACECGT